MNINPAPLALDEITSYLVDFRMFLFLQAKMAGYGVTFSNDYFLHFLRDLAIIQRAKVVTSLQWMRRKSAASGRLQYKDSSIA
jgi:hypothetical protein